MPSMNEMKYSTSHTTVLPTTKKAVAVRGCYPPNMFLHEHPSRIADKNINSPPQSSLSPPFPEINIEAGLAGSVLDKILRERSESEGAKKVAKKRKLMSEMIAENIFQSQGLTSGVMMKHAIHSLNDPRFLSFFCLCRIETAKNEEKKNQAKGTQ